jgi:aminomethyltransferase
MAQGSLSLLHTPLYETHRDLGARLVPFAGWEMPLQYSGILAEARAVRSGLGLFDVSHMGRLQIDGPGAVAFLDSLFTAHVGGLRPGRARYGFLLTEGGGIMDDVVVYRLTPADKAEDRLALVCNASNRDAVVAWLEQRRDAHPGVAVRDVTRETAMVAVQGPLAAQAVDRLYGGAEEGEGDGAPDDAPPAPSALRPFGLSERPVALDPGPVHVESLLSRTGYTGEDGFEIVVPAGSAQSLWSALTALGGAPCGLGARDALRLEAGLRLHGADMDETVTPMEASLRRFVALDKGDFVGREALLAREAQGLRRALVGFVMRARSIPRHGYPILPLKGSEPIGQVTSGSHSAALDSDIGMGYVPVEYSEPGTSIVVDVRGRHVEARVVALPFYQRQPTG